MSNDQGTKLTAKTAPRTLRAVLYARVSTDEQAEKGYSLPSQLEACRRYAQAHGFTVVAEFTDDITGITFFTERPGGKQAQVKLDHKEANIIIMYQVDRLSRDIVGLLQAVRDWLRAGIQVYACDVGQIKSENDIILIIKGWQAGDEREKTRERTTRGRNGKARSGKVVCSGYPPYGYKFADDQLVVIEEEANVVRLMFQWYTIGDESNNGPLNDYAISRKLSHLRIPTPGESKGRKRERASCMWDTSTVNRILISEVYSGVLRYGRHIGSEGKGGPRPIEEQIAISVPAIVSLDTWKAAQARRKYNKEMSKRNCRREYLLRGRIHCGCGCKMSGLKCSIKSFHEYKCNAGAHQFPELEERPCRQKPVHGDIVEAIAWEYVLDVMCSDSESFKERLLEAQKQESEALQPKHDQLAMMKELIAKCKADAAKLAQAMINSPGGIVGDVLQKQINDINDLYTSLVQQRDTLLVELENQTLTDAQIEAALRFRDAVVTGLQNPTFEDMFRTFEDLDVRVVVEGSKVRVRCRIPVPEGVFDLHTFGKGPNGFAVSNSALPIHPDFGSRPAIA